MDWFVRTQQIIKIGGLCIPMFINFLIVLNIYNGDVLGIDENIEYSLWFILPMFINIVFDLSTYTYISLVGMYILYSSYFPWTIGIISNMYWYVYYPWKSEPDPRHRTEFYDTKILLCSMLYTQLLFILIGIQMHAHAHTVPATLIMSLKRFESGTTHIPTPLAVI